MATSIAGRVEAILYGLAAGVSTVVVFEVAVLFLAIPVKWLFHYTGWVHLGSELSAWFGVVFLYWGFLPAVFLGAIVGVRACKSRWNGKLTQ